MGIPEMISQSYDHSGQFAAVCRASCALMLSLIESQAGYNYAEDAHLVDINGLHRGVCGL